MSRLKVMLRGALISEIELSQEKEYIGGRKEGSDIRLQAEKGISREHFRLKFSEGKWTMGAISRFGDVFSLGQKVEQAELQHGQSFQIPPYEFVFLDVPDAGLPNAANQSAPVDFGENEKTVIGAAPQVPYIKMVNSTGEISEMLRLEVGDVWVAGRDPSCQIIIPDQRVSRRQFEIYKVNGAYTILDLASVNGTFLNGSPVSSTDPQSLKSGDAISVLDNSMFFELHDPNFKYKVEKIEVPPMPMEQMEEDSYQEAPPPEVYEDAPPMEQYDQYEVPQQLMTTDNPFTGMPGQEQDPNQYYSFQAPPEAQAAPLNPVQKLMQNKPLLAALAVVVLGGAYWFSTMTSEEPVKPAQVVKANDSDPFSKLKPQQQKEVEELYSLADQMYNQQKYDLALEKIKKIKEILPTGYKESDKIAQDAEQAIQTIAQQQKDEDARREKEERDAKSKEIASACEKKINPDITSTDMSNCLAEVIRNNPNDPDYQRIMEQVEKIEKERLAKETEARNYAQSVAELKAEFAAAEKTQADGFAFKAIKKYRGVVQSNLEDPGKLKNLAKERIEFIEEKIKEKSEGSVSQAEKLFKEGKIKQAVSTLRNAVVYDPANKLIKERIEVYGLELQRQVRLLYQEAIIDENYGLIENTETKQGAKDKWKKITDIDLEDSEYYRKAIVKLRRYGVM